MNKVVIGSTDKNAGKTSIIVGMARTMGKGFGYMKPFGDRLHYRKKRSWDYDTALMTNIFSLEENPEHMTIGFEHSKLRYAYDETSARNKLVDMVHQVEAGKDVLFIEGGRDLRYGVSVHLDSIALARYLGCRLTVVTGGDEDSIMDNIAFLRKYLALSDVDFAGVIINKVHDVKDFKDAYLPGISRMGVNVLGVIPYEAGLARFSVGFLSDYLFARVVAGERGLDRTVDNIFVGAMSVADAFRHVLFQKKNRLMITSGDRSDMILASILENETVGIVITNNILPPPNILSQSEERNIPLLLVPFDTYEAARRIERIEPLLMEGDTAKIHRLEQLVRDHVNMELLGC